MRRILVLRGGALGDFLVTLPALALLRRRWPGAVIELAGNPVAGELARSRGLLQAVHSSAQARWAALYAAAPLGDDFGRWLAEFDLVLSYWPDPDGTLAHHFPRRPDQRFVAHPSQPSRGPAAAHYADALRPWGLEPPAPLCRLEPGAVVDHPVPIDPRERRRQLTRSGPGRIVLHPGSGSARKNWPVERWAEVAGWLRTTRHVEVVACAGEAEAGRPLAGLGEVRTGLSLPQLEDLLRSACLFLGHDSGVSHLAAACGVPSLLLFGPTDPTLWAPPTDEVRILHRPGPLTGLTVAEVKAAISDALS